MVVFSDGFETNDYTAWTGTIIGAGQTLATSTLNVKSGTYSSKSVGTNAGRHSYCYKDIASAALYYLRFYVKVTSCGDSRSYIGMLFKNPDSSYPMVGLGVNGATHTLYLRYLTSDWSTHFVTSATTLTVDTQYCIEIMCNNAGAGTGVINIWRDGIKVDDLTVTGITLLGNANRVGVGNQDCWTAITNYVDDIVVNTSYIGPEAAGVTVKRGGNSALMAALVAGRLFS